MILLEAKYALLDLEIIFIFFGPSMATLSSDRISILSSKFISLMTPSETFFMSFELVSSNKLSSIYMSSVFIRSLKGYFHLTRHQLNL